MAIPCESCGAQNPATNRFCGQCGRKLTASPNSEAPEEFWRDATTSAHKPLEPSSDLPANVTFGNEIPLFEGKDLNPRLYQADATNEIHDRFEREAEPHDQLRHAHEAHHEVRAHENAASDLPPAAEERPIRTGISGPSFLGLTDDHPATYLLDDAEPKSHARRNIALVVLLAAVILLGLQWRSMRDYGLAYVQNGSMQVKPRAKGDAQNPPAVAADNTSRDLGLPPASAKPGSPTAVENSPNANRIPPSETAATAPTATAPASSPHPLAMSAPPADIPQNNAAAAPPEAAPMRSSAKPRAAQPSPRASQSASLPGTEEMSRAARASDAEARAAWLWRALGKGNPQAPVELARMYELGAGVVRSCDQAQVLLRSAAAKGNEQAKLNLQQMRMRGCR